MSSKFEQCLRNRGLRKVPSRERNVEGEIREAGKDLESARRSLGEQDYKWTIIKSYYSMFHALKSLLFVAGYRKGSHECLVVGIEELFVAKGLLPASLATDLRHAKAAREAADYGLTYGRDAAEGILKDAAEVHRIASEFLAEKGSG
jgi:uncharacterized protein (UPF0332 family)